MNQDKLIRIFDKQANGYEKRRKNQSQAKWREKLLSSAKGKKRWRSLLVREQIFNTIQGELK